MRDPPLSTSPTPSEKEWRKRHRRFSAEELRRLPCAFRVGLPRGEGSVLEGSWGSASSLPHLSDSPPSGVGLPGSCHGDWPSWGWSLLESAGLAKSLSSVRLCDPMGSSPPGSVHGILPARILDWVAISFSRGPSQLRDQTQVSHIMGGFLADWATRDRGGREKSLRTDENRVGSLFVYKLLR